MTEAALAIAIGLTLASEIGAWQQWAASYAAIVAAGVIGRAVLWA